MLVWLAIKALMPSAHLLTLMPTPTAACTHGLNGLAMTSKATTHVNSSQMRAFSAKLSHGVSQSSLMLLHHQATNQALTVPTQSSSSSLW
jgi:hypothetical protein